MPVLLMRVVRILPARTGPAGENSMNPVTLRETVIYGVLDGRVARTPQRDPQLESCGVVGS
jgi:hypothetical protein